MKVKWVFEGESEQWSKVSNGAEFLQVLKEFDVIYSEGTSYEVSSKELTIDDEPYIEIWLDEKS